MERLGIEYLSVFGMHPVAFVELAASLGCRFVSTGLVLRPLPVLGDPAFSLRDDPRLRREMVAAMTDLDVSISLGEGLLVRPGADARDMEADLDVMVELGIRRVNTVSIEPDVARTYDEIGVVAELAAERGMSTVTEPIPGFTICDLASGVAAVEHVGRDDYGLLIDVMHLTRSGASPSDLGAVDPGVIAYAQLCDVPLESAYDDYLFEAMFERLVPGDGEAPVREFVSALPADVVIGLEIPQRSLALAGVSAMDRLRPCVEAARALL